MKAIVQSEFGPPSEVLRVADVERPKLKDDEALVRVCATAVHADLWHSVTGRPLYMRMMVGWRRPRGPIPGTDVAGVVEAVGPRVTRFKLGDEVFGTTTRSFPLGNWGAFAEYAAAPERSLASKPANVTFEQAASVPASGYIAYLNTFHLEPRLRGKRVLVNGAGGGVGTIVLQIAKAYGAHVTAVDAGLKLEMLRTLGADETVDYTRTSFLDLGIQYDVIFDVASNRTLEECRSALKPDGLFIWIGHEHYGRAAGSRMFGHGMPRMLRLMRKSLFRAPNLPKMKFAIPKLADALAALRDLMAEGNLTPAVERAYPLESFAEAFRVLEEGAVQGKVVLVP